MDMRLTAYEKKRKKWQVLYKRGYCVILPFFQAQGMNRSTYTSNFSSKYVFYGDK